MKQYLSFSSVLLVGFMLTAVPQMTRAVSATCFDVTGSGEQVLVDGQVNAGILDFQTQVPDTQYEACVEDPGQDGVGDFELKGWAWNTNLGWISFSCSDENGDGAPYENLGVPCGNYQYGVTMEGPDGTDPARLSGYAWGDNAGWMSLNCSDLGVCGTYSYYVEAETTDEDCLGNVYASDAFCAMTPARPMASVYAWLDSVGWLSFDGVVFPWSSFVVEPSLDVDVDPEILTPTGDDSSLGNKDDAPISNDDDSHKLVLHLTKDGLPLENPEDYTLNVEIDWYDTVDLNQTDLLNGDYGDCSAPCAGGAVTKPNGASFDMANYGADPEYPDAVVAEVTSKAPTSSLNGLDENMDGFVDFPFEHFILGDPNGGNPVPANELRVENIRISLLNPEGACSFGGMGCSAVSVLGAPVTLGFAPAVDIIQFDDQQNGYFINAQNTVANAFDTAAFCGLLNCSTATMNFLTGVDGDFAYVYDANGDGADVNDPVDFDLNTYGAPFVFNLTPVCDAQGGAECVSEAANAYAYSVAQYVLGGQPVLYFNNKLPRVEGTLVVNPVASIRGNVYSTGVTNPQTGEEVRSIGELSTNILRDALFRNVSNILAGTARPAGDATITGWNGGSGFTVAGNSASLLPDITGVPKAYYFAGDVTIAAGATLSWSGERTLIIEGGDLYITSDLYNSALGISRPKLGIIVLKDLSAPPAEQGGNVYIASSVKNLQMNVYADGSMFSYDTANGLTATGLPRFNDEADRFNRLKNQLFIEGSVASQNTIGGAAANPPILGDGTAVGGVEGAYGDTPSGRSYARLYDLNFMRYYGLVFERDSGTGDAIDQQGDSFGDAGYLQALPESEGGDLVPVTGGNPALGLEPDDYSSVYVHFDPPPSTLPGFGTTAGVNVRLIP